MDYWDSTDKMNTNSEQNRNKWSTKQHISRVTAQTRDSKVAYWVLHGASNIVTNKLGSEQGVQNFVLTTGGILPPWTKADYINILPLYLYILLT